MTSALAQLLALGAAAAGPEDGINAVPLPLLPLRAACGLRRTGASCFGAVRSAAAFSPLAGAEPSRASVTGEGVFMSNFGASWAGNGLLLSWQESSVLL